VSGRRWGIGLVAVLAGLGIALSSVMATIAVLYSLCEPSQHGPGSTVDDLCSSAPGAVAILAYLAVPTVLVVVGGVLGVRSQRWRTMWLGVGLALLSLIAGGIVFASLPTTA
jgi:hypothetical protein